MKKKEIEYNNLESSYLNMDNQEEIIYDNLSEAQCVCCGVRLTKSEWHEFEDACEECTWENTSGIIDDIPEDEV